MLTWVKSAPMNACSMPIQTVIGTKSCWLAFLHWFIVADNNAIPDNSLADSEPLRFSPYLRIQWIDIIWLCTWKRIQLEWKDINFFAHTVTMDLREGQWQQQHRQYTLNRWLRFQKFPNPVDVRDLHFRLKQQRRNLHRIELMKLRWMCDFRHCRHHEHRPTRPSCWSNFPTIRLFAMPRRRIRRIAQWLHQRLDRWSLRKLDRTGWDRLPLMPT